MLGDVLVIGLGTSGLASARYCSSLLGTECDSVTVVDGSVSPRVAERAEELRALGVRVLLGSEAIPGEYDLGIMSPGIPQHSALMKGALGACSRLVSEIEFAYERSRQTWVAVTGTNGKTTTTSLITHLLNIGGMPSRSVGNIGPTAIGAVADGDDGEVLVAEVSSFQLALTDAFHPRVAVLLNITPDHIDWHGTFERYVEDKARIFRNLGPNDTAVIDIDDEVSRPFAEKLRPSGVKVVSVRLSAGEGAEATVMGDVLTLRGDDDVPLVHLDELLIKGPHNVSNALAAAAAAHAMGIRPESIAEGLRTFRPIEHRLEPCGVACGAEWFNDSKATNPDAVFKALAAFGDQGLILLLGGRNKGNDFRPLAIAAAARAHAVIVFGEAGDEIRAAFDSVGFPVVRAASMREAIALACGVARQGDAVVLSPACASFDEFDNYEQRGLVFKQVVSELGASEPT